MPSFIDAKNLIPFIDNDLMGELKGFDYLAINNRAVSGYKAEILPSLCEVYLKAREEPGVLRVQQLPLAKASEILVRVLSKVGITALIDEATGYQEVRDRLALQKILDKYITDEWAKWTKTFPDEFYKELFRLKNIPYPPDTRTLKKPSYVGHWTNDVVYSRLAPGVLNELRIKNPRQPSGSRRRKFHQYLTRDIGHPALKEHLSNVIFLMKSCAKWEDFKRRLNRARAKYGHTLEIPFDNGDEE